MFTSFRRSAATEESPHLQTRDSSLPLVTQNDTDVFSSLSASSRSWRLLTIGFEVLGTVSLKLSDGFTKLLPSALVVIGYGLSFYLLSLLLKQNAPIGVIYAVWSGLGTVAIVLIGVWLWGERLTLPALLGIAMVIIGVVLINLTTEGAH